MVQDASQHSQQSPEPMLDAVWHDAAQRLSIPAIVACMVLGLAGSISLATAGRLWPVAAACVVLAAFGAYAAVVQADLGGVWLHPTTQRSIATAIATVAVLAGLSAGLLLLAVIFGGSIEVMRR